jgi:preprotein translocase subunit SecA
LNKLRQQKEINEERERQRAPEHLKESASLEDASSQQPKRNVKVGRNDPCPCGSGKKYKQCHG